jgi:hypothetical protein
VSLKVFARLRIPGVAGHSLTVTKQDTGGGCFNLFFGLIGALIVPAIWLLVVAALIKYLFFSK